jgi:cobalt transporter subunit CbtB
MAVTRESGDLPSICNSYGPGGVAKERHMNTQSQVTPSVGRTDSRLEVLTAAAIAFVFGVGLVFTTGFAHSSTIHNAAHDTRHALSFPCH